MRSIRRAVSMSIKFYKVFWYTRTIDKRTAATSVTAVSASQRSKPKIKLQHSCSPHSNLLPEPQTHGSSNSFYATLTAASVTATAASPPPHSKQQQEPPPINSCSRCCNSLPCRNGNSCNRSNTHRKPESPQLCQNGVRQVRIDLMEI